MDIDNFIRLQNDSTCVLNEHLVSLEDMVTSYPYFQSAQAILLKGLRQNDSIQYNKALKTTAAVTIDRSVLFDYINHFEFSEQSLKQKKELTNTTQKSSTKENIQIGAPLEFDKNEAYSFNQWLQLTDKKPIQRTSNTNSFLYKNSSLINRFIEQNPTITPISKDKQSHAFTENSYNEKELMTETLAKVYLEQKKYNNAIKAYDILILKYPEKSGFFADQIKKIELLKNK